MADKILCVLAGFDTETEARLAGLQNSLYEAGFTGWQTKNIPMHTTLCTLPAGQEEALAAAVKAAGENTAPFEVCFSHLGIFTGGEVLFAAPDISRPMLALKEQFGPSEGWAAHSTLLMDKPEVICKALPRAVEGFKSFTGRVERLYLYEFQPPRLLASVPLTGKG